MTRMKVTSFAVFNAQTAMVKSIAVPMEPGLAVTLIGETGSAKLCLHKLPLAHFPPR